MTPGARIAAAIELLDRILDGAAAEQVLTAWARRSRFAGSRDRAAVRDHVFDALRNLQSYQALSGETRWPPTGRALMIGASRAEGVDPAGVFTGQGHAPPPLSSEETARGGSDGGAFNMPDWLHDELCAALGPEDAAAQARVLSQRAPVTLRANAARTSRDVLRGTLEAEGFELRDNPLAPDALTLTGHGRGLMQTAAYRDGLFEMQDAASQAVVAALDVPDGARILDFCAGGGGKALAMAARGAASITAHDVDAARMKDLPDRARRAGVRIDIETDAARLRPGGFDLVLLDVPCSGSGSWRRTPEAKWQFTRARLDQLCEMQRAILAQARTFVATQGTLAYATCSILPAENRQQCAWFIDRFPEWSLTDHRAWPVSADGDGFFLARFQRG